MTRGRAIRLLAAAAIAVSLPGAASAQQRGGRSGPGGRARPPSAPPVTHAPAPPIQPSIGLPLPEIVPPLPPLGLPPVSLSPSFDGRGTHPVYRAGRRGASYGGRNYPVAGFGYVVPAFGLGWTYLAAEPGPAQAAEPLPDVQPLRRYGTLRVEVLAAASAQVYVDGYYVAAGDQAAAGLDLEPGPHRVEVRAAGYEPLTFDVRIAQDQVITFRDAMKPVASVPAAPEPTPKPAAPSIFYVVPGCYIGNVPPANAKLPDGCDPANVQTFKQ